MVELRKRKTPSEPAPPPPAKKSSNPIKKAVEAAKEAVAGSSSDAPNGSGKIAVGSTINLEGFGGDITLHTGEQTTLAKLVDASKSGVVLFTYPKANTPGCTKQACLFRDNHPSITLPEIGLSIFGLSADSPKSNTTFVTKQSLPYPLICDPNQTLISAIGMKKAPKSTARGVVIIDKSGKVQAMKQAGPQDTVDVVMEYVQGKGKNGLSAETKSVPLPPDVAVPPKDANAVAAEEPPKMDEVPIAEENTIEQVESAETAAEVSETAAKIDAVEPAKL